MLSLHLSASSPRFLTTILSRLVVFLISPLPPPHSPWKSSISVWQITAFPYWPGRPHNSRLHLCNKTQQLNERQFVQTEEDAWHGDKGVKSSYWQSVVWVLTRPKRSKLHSNLHDDRGLFPFYFSFELKHAVVNPKSRVNWNKKTSAVSYGRRGQILSLKQEIEPPRVVSNADPQSTACSFVRALVYVKYLNPIPRPMFRMSVIGTFCVLKKCNCVADLVRIKMVYANCAVLKFPPRLLLVAQSSNLHAKWKCCFFGCIFLRSMDETVF